MELKNTVIDSAIAGAVIFIICALLMGISAYLTIARSCACGACCMTLLATILPGLAAAWHINNKNDYIDLLHGTVAGTIASIVCGICTAILCIGGMVFVTMLGITLETEQSPQLLGLNAMTEMVSMVISCVVYTFFLTAAGAIAGGSYGLIKSKF